MVSPSSSVGGGSDSRSHHRSHEELESTRHGGRCHSDLKSNIEEEEWQKRVGHHDRVEDRGERLRESSRCYREGSNRERHHDLDGSERKEDDIQRKRKRHDDKEEDRHKVRYSIDGSKRKEEDIQRKRRRHDGKEEERHTVQYSKRQTESDRRCKDGSKDRDQQQGRDKERDKHRHKEEDKNCYKSKEEEIYKVRPREGDRLCKEGLKEEQQQEIDKERDNERHKEEANKCYSAKQERASRWDEKPPVQTTPLANENRESCMILQNVFDPSVPRDEDFYYKIRNHFLADSVECGVVHHILVDRKCGHVYMLFDSERSGNKAFAKWNNTTYAGNILRAIFCDAAKYSSKYASGRRTEEVAKTSRY